MPALARSALGLVRDELWPYLVFPLLVAAGQLLLGDARGPGAGHALRDAFVISVCVGGPVHLGFRVLFDRLGRLSALGQVAAGVAIVAAGVLVGTEVALAALAPRHEGRDVVAQLGRGRLWLLGFSGFGLVACVLYGFARFRERLEAAALRELRAQRDALAAQLEALQTRIQPHFLFNCLNTVASLIEHEPRKAEAAVERLSDLFRHTLAASKRRFVPLRDEIEAVQGFLELEALRHGDRLHFALRVAPDVAEIPVPPLVLQPLVENAVLHGIAHRREGGRVGVRIERAGPRLVLEVEDDGGGPAGSSHRGTGTALHDLGERLRLLYDGAATLDPIARADGGYLVRVELPLAPPPATPCAS